MNWLIYVSGWFFGIALGIRLGFPLEIDDTEDLITLCVSWTAMWIWICWKFIH